MTRTPLSTNRIHDSLDTALARKRVVFWFDPEAEWASEYESYAPAGVEKREVKGNEFSLKVEISRADLDQRFLLYVPAAKPPEADNWLLDLLLAGHEFKADRASLDLEDAGLTLEFKGLAQQHKEFFKAKARKDKLKKLLRPNDDEHALRLKMLAILAKQDASIDLLLLHAFTQIDPTDPDAEDPIEALYGKHQLTEHFWAAVASKFGYINPQPNLRDFAVALFSSASCVPPKGDLESHARVFLSSWKDSVKSRSAFEQWSNHLADQLNVETFLLDPPKGFDPGDDDSYQLIEQFCIRRLLERFHATATDGELQETIRQRSSSCWFEQHEHGYRAIEQALQFRSLLAQADLQVPSVDEGLKRYCNSWWKLDQAYRRFTFHERSYSQPGLMKSMRNWMEKQYVNNVLLPLTNHWSERVSEMSSWSCEALPPQQQFHMRYVHAPLSSREVKRLFVVISDALRYEAARDFAGRLKAQSGKGWQADVDAVLGVLPSYTQLGMASLLPGNKRTINTSSSNAPAIVDGVSASGTDNRDKILKAYADGRGIAIQAEDFLKLATSTDGAELIKNHDLIVIYHNRIDRIGDKRESEADTCQAVEEAFDDLELILRKISSLKGNRAVITADHGFLFQQEPVDANDRSAFPDGKELTIKKKRFAIGSGIEPAPGQKIFTAEQLKLEGDWQAAFPLGLDRFPLSGAGNRFVHGGTSLQEVVVPVITLKKERKDESREVKVELLRVPEKITTARLKFSLFQDEPCEAKRFLPITLRISVVPKANEKELLCEPVTLRLDSTAVEPREREQLISLKLSNAAGDYNNQLLELRIDRMLEGVQTPVRLETKEVKLLQPFGNDFDDFG